MAVAIRGTRAGGSAGLRSFFSYRIFVIAVFSLLFLATLSALLTSRPPTFLHDSSLPTPCNAYVHAYARKLKLEISKQLRTFDDLATNLSALPTKASHGSLFESQGPLDEDVLRQFEKEVKDRAKIARLLIVESKENYDNQLKIQKLKDTIFSVHELLIKARKNGVLASSIAANVCGGQFCDEACGRGAHVEVKDVEDFKFLNSSSVQRLYSENGVENATKDENKGLDWVMEDYLDGKVNGAVKTCFGSFHPFAHYLNFSHPLIQKRFNPKACAWAYGMNMFYLDAWRREKCMKQYNYWRNLNADLSLWKLGTLPPVLVTFYSLTKYLDKSCQVLGLGYNPTISMDEINKAAVTHYNGNMKPWLDIAMNQYKNLWTKYVDSEMEFVQGCNFGF
ncbi:hypothetical protein SLE2022_276560 [Rubroshorea leprosula]